MTLEEQGINQLLLQLPNTQEGVLGRNRRFIEQSSTSAGCIAYWVDARDQHGADEGARDLRERVFNEHSDLNVVPLTQDTNERGFFALAYDPSISPAVTQDVGEALGDVQSICEIRDQDKETLVFVRAFHEDRTPITQREILKRLALVSGNLHQAGYFKGLGSDKETTPHYSERDSLFVFSFPKSERIYVGSGDAREQRERSQALSSEALRGEVQLLEKDLEIDSGKGEKVHITLHEMSGPSGSVYAIELPPEYAEEHNIDSNTVHGLLNRAIEELQSQHFPYSSFPELIPLPTVTVKEGATAEPYRLFVVATRADKGGASHQADFVRLSRTMKRLTGVKEKLKENRLELTIDGQTDTRSPGLTELDLHASLARVYSVLEKIHGNYAYQTNLRVASGAESGKRNAYRMRGDTRQFSLTVMTT